MGLAQKGDLFFSHFCRPTSSICQVCALILCGFKLIEMEVAFLSGVQYLCEVLFYCCLIGVEQTNLTGGSNDL